MCSAQLLSVMNCSSLNWWYWYYFLNVLMFISYTFRGKLYMQELAVASDQINGNFKSKDKLASALKLSGFVDISKVCNIFSLFLYFPVIWVLQWDNFEYIDHRLRYKTNDLLYCSNIYLLWVPIFTYEKRNPIKYWVSIGSGNRNHFCLKRHCFGSFLIGK